MSRVILLHGKDRSPGDLWYPWIKNQCQQLSIECLTPEMPKDGPPILAKWLAVLDNLAPAGDDILVGHSRGGMAILRWLEKPRRPIKKAVLIAANSALIEDDSKGDFYGKPYDFEKIKLNCSSFVLFHSKDDKWVPYEAGQYNAEHLGGKLVGFDNKSHFGNQSDGSALVELPELLEEIVR